MPGYKRVSGVWKRILHCYRNVGGVWTEINTATQRVSGVQKGFVGSKTFDMTHAASDFTGIQWYGYGGANNGVGSQAFGVLDSRDATPVTKWRGIEIDLFATTDAAAGQLYLRLNGTHPAGFFYDIDCSLGTFLASNAAHSQFGGQTQWYWANVGDPFPNSGSEVITITM